MISVGFKPEQVRSRREGIGFTGERKLAAEPINRWRRSPSCDMTMCQAVGLRLSPDLGDDTFGQAPQKGGQGQSVVDPTGPNFLPDLG